MSTDPLYASEPGRERPTDARVTARYGALRRQGTSPEMALRRELFRRGLRYRIQYKVPGLPRRKVDIAFTKHKIAVQVDGCFWHGCPQHGTMPGRNSEWWAWKIARNQARDRDTDAKLEALGWRVIHVWEHEDIVQAASSVSETLHEIQSR